MASKNHNCIFITGIINSVNDLILYLTQGAFFCRFPGIKGNGAEANLDGAEKNQEGITAVKPLQDGADLDGVEKIRRELKWRSCYKTAPRRRPGRR